MIEIEFVNRSTVELYKCNASDLDVARAAWVSQDAQAHEKENTPGRIEGLIQFLYRNSHMSPFSHGQFTFIIHAPLWVAREHMRHRTWHFNELSARYTDVPLKFYLPTENRPLKQIGKVGSYTFSEGDLQQKEAVNNAIKKYSAQSAHEYRSLLDQGVAKEVARNVLPQNVMTSYWATTDPRNLMNFLDLRLHHDAAWEIRDLAGAMEVYLQEKMPLTYKAYKEK